LSRPQNHFFLFPPSVACIIAWIAISIARNEIGIWETQIIENGSKNDELEFKRRKSLICNKKWIEYYIHSAAVVKNK